MRSFINNFFLELSDEIAAHLLTQSPEILNSPELLAECIYNFITARKS